MNKIFNFLKLIKRLFKNLYDYRTIMLYIYKKGGIKRLYNFLWAKSFILAGGEGSDNWVAAIFLPILNRLPKIAPYIIGYPKVIEIEVTTKCNKKCLICEHTYWDEPIRELSLEQFKRIYSNFPNLKWINLTGEGDAFLNKDYLNIIKFLKQNHVYVSLVDSFDLIDEKISKELIEAGVDTIYISFDAGTKETYEKIKVGCKFEKTLNNIRNLLNLKKELNSPLPEIYFRYIVNKLNLNEMEEFLDILHSLNPKLFGVNSRIEFTGLLYYPEIKDLFIEKIPEEIICKVEEKAKKLGINISFVHPQHPKNLPPMHLCMAWQEPYIIIDGDVMPCCAVLMSNRREFLKKHSFGNIYQKTFKEIWYSERYKKFRKMIKDKNSPVPILCRGCRVYNTIDREEKYGVSDTI